jgi:hypothetical protein
LAVIGPVFSSAASLLLGPSSLRSCVVGAGPVLVEVLGNLSRVFRLWSLVRTYDRLSSMGQFRRDKMHYVHVSLVGMRTVSTFKVRRYAYLFLLLRSATLLGGANERY